MKAILLEKGNEIPKIHDLVGLAKILDLDESMISDCEKLTVVYLDARYPDIGTEKYTKKEASEDIQIAEGILKWARKNPS